MLLFPEIVLRGGKTLEGGELLAQAHDYRNAGATCLRVAAEGGGAPNYVAAKQLVESSGLQVMLAGGMTSREAAEKFLCSCAGIIVLDSSTVRKDPALLAELVRVYPEHIAVEFDISDVDAAAFAQEMRQAGVKTLIISDSTGAAGVPVYRDLQIEGMAIIIRGGITTMEQLRRWNEAGVYGAILDSAALESLPELGSCVRAVQPAASAFGSVEQRMAFTYLETFPGFIPAKAAPVTEAEQRAFYEFVHALYQLAYEAPDLLVKSLHADGTYLNPFQALNTGRPGLKQEMDAFNKRMTELLKYLFTAGGGKTPRGSVPKTEKGFKDFLKRLGITGNAEAFAALYPAWGWLCTRPGANWVTFAACVFDVGYPYARDVWASLLGDEAYGKLENALLSRGYSCVTGYGNGEAPEVDSLPLSLTYANLAWDATPPSAGHLYGTRHTGMTTIYTRGCQARAMLALQIPNEAKVGLPYAADAPPPARELILERIKRCDGCGYCTQTDKTGKRQRAFIPTTWEGETILFCPYYAVFNCCWVRLDESSVDKIIAYLEWLDSFVLPKLREKKPQKKKAAAIAFM
jgi:phosphoribosylformimino-5-aminoimidazole carboxamide ribonucleotide (ProFAR) isomerase